MNIAEAIAAATTPEKLIEALKPVDAWEYTEEQKAAIKRSWQYVPDKDVYAGFAVNSINEWRVSQSRVLILSKSAYYRVSYNAKNGKVDHYHKTPLQQLRVLEKTTTGLKVFLAEQDGYSGPKKWMGSLAGAIGVRKQTPNEFQHAREYLPALAAEEPASDVIVDIIAAAFAKAASLLKESNPELNFDPPSVITTEQRYQILADRKEAERLAAEKKERETAEAELRQAMSAATESRDGSMLARPIRRAKRAVEADAALLDSADEMVKTLEAEKKERELQERLENERKEREAATAELEEAIGAARQSREPSTLAKPIRRCKKAVGVSEELIGEAEALKSEIEAEIKAEKARLAAELAEKKAAEKKAAEAAAAEKKAAAEEAAARAKAAKDAEAAQSGGDG